MSGHVPSGRKASDVVQPLALIDVVGYIRLPCGSDSNRARAGVPSNALCETLPVPLSRRVRGRSPMPEAVARIATALVRSPRRLADQPHLNLSNPTVSPLALELRCTVSWAVIVEPSEPVRCSVKVE